MAGIPEIITHTFWDHMITWRLWEFFIKIINMMKTKPRQKEP